MVPVNGNEESTVWLTGGLFTVWLIGGLFVEFSPLTDSAPLVVGTTGPLGLGESEPQATMNCNRQTNKKNLSKALTFQKVIKALSMAHRLRLRNYYNQTVYYAVKPANLYINM